MNAAIKQNNRHTRCKCTNRWKTLF